MEWFHFSDFHIGKPRGPQTTALASLIEAVRNVAASGSGKVDAVFLTGDMAYSGKKEEYHRFTEDFLLPLKSLPAFATATVFAVPGNHDVDCDATLPITWEGIGTRNQEVFFCENEEGIKARKSRVIVLEAYWDFISNNSIISPNPFEQVTLLYPTTYPYDILLTNTALFSDREKNSSGETTPSPIASLRDAIRKGTSDKPYVILAHHSPTCFLKTDQTPFRTFLGDKKAVFFHGHEHRAQPVFGGDGTLRILGFGASYLASLQSDTVSPYRNSFAHCRLDTALMLQSFSWEPSIGRWDNSTSTMLPDCIPANSPGSRCACVAFPRISDGLRSDNQNLPLASLRRTPPRPTRLIPVDATCTEAFKRIFAVSRNLRVLCQKDNTAMRPIPSDDGKLRFTLELPNGQRDLLIFIGGVNHVLSSKEIESINTQLDTEGFSSATVISLGRISNDAQSMYLRLQARKPIEVVVDQGLIAESDRLLSDEQRAAVARLDAAEQSVCILLGENDIYLLVVNEGVTDRSFCIISGSGHTLPPTDAVVAAIRRGTPDFTLMHYTGDVGVSPMSVASGFKEREYLNACYAEYNVVKYAALANVGLRFSELPLAELYVNASATEVENEASRRTEQIVGDHLATYPVSDELRKHIQKQLLASVTQGDRGETSGAREFCQKYGAVLVTGDPGSGKTCFVKNEILAYCRRGLVKSNGVTDVVTDWHSNHVPVMISLSEAVAEKDLDDAGLLVIASRLLERRGLGFPSGDMKRLVLEGRVAFFFDGLDEVVSVEKRATIVKHINELVDSSLSVGNRITVTSRPAAVQVVNLLPSLHKLELQGLSESEMSLLASRILALRLADTKEGVQIADGQPRQNDSQLISQLLADCQKNPGVSRLAQNPLLLTLLILIYANSGAPSAKRHLIYEEAIKTLASVRGREAGHQPISLQDLRERLGAIALSVYRKQSGLLPSRAEVCEVLRNVMGRQRHEDVSVADANLFIQRVAESTGLVAVEGRRGQEDSAAIVTFMHHSFLEYFAAIGLSRDLDQIDLGSLVNEPRWHEILTLLAGIVGENEDVAPVIEKFLRARPEEAEVDAKLLLFAIDCAIECDLPSEAAQRLLAKHIRVCLSNGAGRLDPWVRSEIGQRLECLLSVCGGSEFDKMLSELMASGDEGISAAALDVAGHACANGYESVEIRTAYEHACTRVDRAVCSAVCAAAGRSRVLRTNAALQVVASSLHKSRASQRVAYEALATIPGLASKHWEDIINGIDDTDPGTSRWASIAAMMAGLNADIISLSAPRKDILLRALNNIETLAGNQDTQHTRVQKATLARLLASGSLRDRMLGIRLVPLVDSDEQYVYDQLMGMVRRGGDHEEIVAALIALKASGKALSLLRLGDLRVVVSCLKEGTADVRVAATELLGCFGSDLPAVEALFTADWKTMNVAEYCARIQALSRAKVDTENVKGFFFREIAYCLGETMKMNPDNLRRAKTLLDGARRLGETASDSLVSKIRTTMTHFKTEDSLKRRALLCYPAIAMPSQRIVKSIAELYGGSLPGMEAELVQLPGILAKKCRQSVDYVVACVASLEELRTVLVSYHRNLLKRSVTPDNEFYVTELRSGISDVTQILVAFRDFIGPVKGALPRIEKSIPELKGVIGAGPQANN